MCKELFRSNRSNTRMLKGNLRSPELSKTTRNGPSASLLTRGHVLAPGDYARSALPSASHYKHARLSPRCSRHLTWHAPSNVLGERLRARGGTRGQVHTRLIPKRLTRSTRRVLGRTLRKWQLTKVGTCSQGCTRLILARLSATLATTRSHDPTTRIISHK